MGHLLKLATHSLRCIPAFFRSRSDQAIVELALRQQLATFGQKGLPAVLAIHFEAWSWSPSDSG